jgi:hypothetical protein
VEHQPSQHCQAEARGQDQQSRHRIYLVVEHQPSQHCQAEARGQDQLSRHRIYLVVEHQPSQHCQADQKAKINNLDIENTYILFVIF